MALAVSTDQGSDGWSACNWLLYSSNARCAILPDMSHRAWNDLKEALAASGFDHAIFLWGKFFNWNVGPIPGSSLVATDASGC